MPEEEKLYTLDQARLILQSKLCIKMHGEHDLRQTVTTNFMGITYLFCVVCTRCELEFVPRYQE